MKSVIVRHVYSQVGEICVFYDGKQKGKAMQELEVSELFSRIKPEGCVFVITVNAAGNPTGMACGWSMKCSFDPPLYAVSISKDCFTQSLIRESGEFVVAIPNKKLEKALLFFGSVSGRTCDKFAASGLKTVPSNHLRTPLIADATFNLECKLFREIECGNHVMFLGQVVAVHVNEGEKVLLNMKKVNGERRFEEF